MDIAFLKLDLKVWLDMTQPWVGLEDGSEGWHPLDADCPAFIRKGFDLGFVVDEARPQGESALRNHRRLASLVPAFKRRGTRWNLSVKFLSAS